MYILSKKLPNNSPKSPYLWGMRVYTHIQKGQYHPTFCEDFLLHQSINKRFVLAAVMDGCSMGRESHFASALFGKLLRKCLKLLPYQLPLTTELPLQTLAKSLLQSFFQAVREAQNQLFLEQLDLLSTLILHLYDKHNQLSYIIALGDGLICIDNQIIDLDQVDKPDYLAYHLHEDFEQWYEKQEQIWLVESPRDISIVTDGIHTFNIVGALKEKETVTPLHYLLFDTKGAHLDRMLETKCRRLEEDFGVAPTDDLAIVRMRF